MMYHQARHNRDQHGGKGKVEELQGKNLLWNAAPRDEQALVVMPIVESADVWFSDSSVVSKTSSQIATSSIEDFSTSPCSSEDDTGLLITMRLEHPTPLEKQTKKRRVHTLSTERSRQYRQRQKVYLENLEAVVRELHIDVQGLEILRNLRQEQSVNLRGSVTGSLATIIREYMTVFRHGMPAAAMEDVSAGKKRERTVDNLLTPDEQHAFLNCIMDPYVEVFDWCGRFVLGASALLNGWTAWAAWHECLTFDLVGIDVLDTEDTLAVTTKANLRVCVSQRTIEHLFPHIADNRELCRKLIGKEICYPIQDTFFFASNKQIIKYVCDIDFLSGLLAVAGDYETVLYLMAPPNQTPLNDLAVRTSPGDLAERSPLDVEFLLSNE
ncbi:unnamed protein product [Peronospora farinosa]|uniref:BZIP domain-containing protein n=1 Tax=Peronospora farinosa TaxID=134698 RepID=A0AAV0SUI0_9STRA|nr:unnamed protein product [Peronospora farinosa]